MEEEIQKYIELSEDELYVELALASEGAAALPMKVKDKIDIGKLKFHNTLNKIKGLICKPEVIEFLRAEKDMVKLGIAIGNIISAVYLGVPTVLIVVIISKIGVDKLCDHE